MDEKKKSYFADFLKLLTEKKDKIIVYPPRRKQILYFEIHDISFDDIEQFETLGKKLKIQVNDHVIYYKVLKKEFQKKAARLENERSVMEMELDEMEDDECLIMDISTDGKFGPSWYPQEHWYDWIPDYKNGKIKFTLSKDEKYNFDDDKLAELVKFINSCTKFISK